MTESLTYGKLMDLLASLGYSHRSMQWNETEQWVFEHDQAKNATIFLPQRPLNQVVHPMHLGSVRATLKAHGLMNENADSFV